MRFLWKWPLARQRRREIELDYILSLDNQTTITRSQDMNMVMQVHPGELGIKVAFFKIFNNANEKQATKVARIAFAHAEYVATQIKRRKDKATWRLTDEEKEYLIQFLQRKNEYFAQYSNWQLAILMYNHENGLDFAQSQKNKLSSGTLLFPEFLPCDLAMPDYMKLN